MNILVVGSGGREHALAWKLSQTADVFCCPGNPGIAKVAQLREGSITDAFRLMEICREDAIDLVVFGPERPLIAGMADALRSAGIAVYGPSAVCAQIEGSKAFAKRVMAEVGVPTAAYREFDDFPSAKEYIESEYASGREVVVKASGEALGKGAVVAEDAHHAVKTAERMLVDREFGDAGSVVVVEERLCGREVSLIAICSGTDYAVMPSAQDYKSAFDGGVGPNTGGMGAISPAPWIDEKLFVSWGGLFIEPILRYFESRGTPYVGTLYAGLMVTSDGPRALEYNARFGDPETQAVLPRIENDFAEILMCAAHGKDIPRLVASAAASATVVIAAQGYPGEYAKGIPLPDLGAIPNVIQFHAGTGLADGELVSTGGRVLNLTALAKDTGTAARIVYESIGDRFDSRWHYRRDIGQ